MKTYINNYGGGERFGPGSWFPKRQLATGALEDANWIIDIGVGAGTVVAKIASNLAAKLGTKVIYRVVSNAEAADALAYGFRQAPIISKISSYEGKLFWSNIKDAKWYLNWVGEGNQILKIRVNSSFIFEKGDDVGKLFYYVTPERMKTFNSAIKSIVKTK